MLRRKVKYDIYEDHIRLVKVIKQEYNELRKLERAYIEKAKYIISLYHALDASAQKLLASLKPEIERLKTIIETVESKTISSIPQER